MAWKFVALSDRKALGARKGRAIAADRESKNEFEPLISREQGTSAKPHLIDWRFLPEPVLLAKDALRSGIMFAGRNALPASWRARLWAHTFGAWAIQAIDRAGILYVHIPKTGGTSVSNILYGRNLPHFTASFYQLALGPRFSSLTRFATIRHPTKRLLSAWNFLRAGGSASIAADRWHWSKISKPRSFEDFVELIVNRRDLRDMILPLRSQSEFITEGDRLLVDRLFPLDARKGFSPSLMAFLGVEAVPHLNGSPPLSAAKLSSAAEQRIGEMYARDFALWHQVTKSGNDLLLR